MPLISVVIPAKNASATLGTTLKSLMSQTFRDFEVILIDDGSTDETVAVAAQYADDLPIHLISHPASKGVAEAINAGVTASSSEFIARLDADDLAREDRLEKQLSWMQADQRLDICGSSMAMFSDAAPGDISVRMLQHPTDHDRIKTGLLQRNTLAHPSLLIRRRFFERTGLYDARFEYAEDYELWARGAMLGCQYANIDEPLTYYRLHAGQVSQQKAQTQCERDLLVKKKLIHGLLDGSPMAYSAELLSPLVQFASREQAWKAWSESLAVLVELAARVRSPQEYAAILSESTQRHLR